MESKYNMQKEKFIAKNFYEREEVQYDVYESLESHERDFEEINGIRTYYKLCPPQINN
ncbi:hypothetical protein N3C_0861 [Clostridium sp. N3C]|uniref:hypothetical protein n=1 Tax=Clostridium sp. N3C TaxID=1776758 RepID=UPI00092DF3F8|nr:hypothetical protein [Clostridium sp. N3C]NLZ34568.1 hypothetical protein [Clostridiales bacterium]SCN22597.1 hypothetical protein N3C_0861 [Clostridium sp. N3C]